MVWIGGCYSEAQQWNSYPFYCFGVSCARLFKRFKYCFIDIFMDMRFFRSIANYCFIIFFTQSQFISDNLTISVTIRSLAVLIGGYSPKISGGCVVCL